MSTLQIPSIKHFSILGPCLKNVYILDSYIKAFPPIGLMLKGLCTFETHPLKNFSYLKLMLKGLCTFQYLLIHLRLSLYIIDSPSKSIFLLLGLMINGLWTSQKPL